MLKNFLLTWTVKLNLGDIFNVTVTHSTKSSPSTIKISKSRQMKSLFILHVLISKQTAVCLLRRLKVSINFKVACERATCYPSHSTSSKKKIPDLYFQHIHNSRALLTAGANYYFWELFGHVETKWRHPENFYVFRRSFRCDKWIFKPKK